MELTIKEIFERKLLKPDIVDVGYVFGLYEGLVVGRIRYSLADNSYILYDLNDDMIDEIDYDEIDENTLLTLVVIAPWDGE